MPRLGVLCGEGKLVLDGGDLAEYPLPAEPVVGVLIQNTIPSWSSWACCCAVALTMASPAMQELTR